MVQHETHRFDKDMFNTTLVLETNLMGYKTIRCEINMVDQTVCKDTIGIEFAGMEGTDQPRELIDTWWKLPLSKRRHI